MLKLSQAAVVSTGLILSTMAQEFGPSLWHLMGLPLVLDFSSPALAQDRSIRYVPPDRGAPQRTRGAGSRGCSLALPSSLELLVPTDHIGLTALSHPSFAWHVTNPAGVPMEFTLVEPGRPEPLWVQQLPATKSGIMTLKLPQDRPALFLNQKYRWSVSLLCYPNRPSANIFAQAWIKRVTQTPSQILGSEGERAVQLARRGLWYDALEEMLQARTSQPTDPAIAENFLSLLQQAGLTNVATLERQRLTRN